MKIKKVFSSKVANELRHQGFWIIKTEPNMKKPWFDVFIFEATDEMLAAYDKILSSYQKKEK